MEMNVYVGTYHKYNSGSIFGKWMNLEDYSSKEEFLAACRELHSDEKDPEFMFQDYEYIPEGMIDESYIDERIWDIIEMNEDDFDIFKNYMESHCCGFDHAIDHFKDDYIGEFDSYNELGIFFSECLNIPSEIEIYFDYESYGRDISFDLIEYNNRYWFK